jgi:hypothetical protein
MAIMRRKEVPSLEVDEAFTILSVSLPSPVPGKEKQYYLLALDFDFLSSLIRSAATMHS